MHLPITLVHTENGLKPISEIKIGDKVLSYDERTENTSYQPVMDIIQGEKQYQIVKLTLNSGESIETTPEHSFYIKGKGWNPASSLKVGQILQLHNGTTVVVKEIDTSVQLGKVYNLTVANTHNYYVGQDGVLVHNCKKNKTKHGEQRNQEKRTDHHRDVGDPHDVIKNGRKLKDSDTGNDIYVDGDRVVIVDQNGNIHTQFKNTKANTQKRIQSRKWVLPDLPNF